jgi:hypothetical protein
LASVRRASACQISQRVALCALVAGALSGVVGVGQAVADDPKAVACDDTISAPGQY